MLISGLGTGWALEVREILGRGSLWGIWRSHWGFHMFYPLVNIQKAIENDHL